MISNKNNLQSLFYIFITTHLILWTLIPSLTNNNLPVFPLGIVALPGSIQSLQIFEPRYIQMVKTCLSKNHGFVIVFNANNEFQGDLLSERFE